MSKYALTIEVTATKVLDDEGAELYASHTPEQRAEVLARGKAEVERHFNEQMEGPESLSVKVEITEVAEVADECQNDTTTN